MGVAIAIGGSGAIERWTSELATDRRRGMRRKT